MNDLNCEIEFLESRANTYVTSKDPWDRIVKKYAMRNFSSYIADNGSALEFGCADGFMTRLISERMKKLISVDGSMTFIEMARAKTPANVEFAHSLFENYFTEERFDYVFATFVLEHVQNPIAFLKTAKRLLKPSGFLFLVVPNARSASRQLARHMGLLENLYELTPNDINHGHRRIYDRVTLNHDIEVAGLHQTAQGGLMWKPFADFQMSKAIEAGILSSPQLDGLYKMGLEYPEMAGCLYSICCSCLQTHLDLPKCN
jgi:2-polyprenyl-3-methyl-5-hydroxy-6-metoxy-1,4-benzoquinol methylase